LAKTRKLLLEYETEEVGRLAREDPREKKALVKAFGDSSDVVRERALIASVETADPTLVTNITKALSDNVPDVRIAAAQALAFYHQPVTVPDLLKGLKDENTWVRSHCAAGLSKILNGPIWARIPGEDIDKIIDDFPDMTEDEVDSFLASIKMKPGAINRFKTWREKKFKLEIDESELIAELESKPILLSEETLASTPSAKSTKDEVEAILAELPDELRETLPPEDIKRLTPDSARELVRQLKVSVPTAEKKKKKKKAVKVKKVKRVRKKKKKTEKDELIERLPVEVRESVGEAALADLTTDELEALLASSGEAETEAEVSEVEDTDPRMKELSEKYGPEKAEILATIPEPMLQDIPEDQIKEMDLETLKGLAQALEPR